MPRGDKSIGYVFGMIESKKEDYGIAEYSVGQTTLEQIFQAFANLDLDKKGALYQLEIDGTIGRRETSSVNLLKNDQIE